MSKRHDKKYYICNNSGNNGCCNFSTLVILILIILQFGKRCGCNPQPNCSCSSNQCGNNCGGNRVSNKGCVVDNSILFIITLYYLSCCNPGNNCCRAICC